MAFNVNTFLKDFEPGPLDFYRQKASFDWKRMKLFIDTEDIIKFQNDIVEKLRKHPVYHKTLMSLSFDEQRKVSAQQSFIYKNTDLLKQEYALQNLRRPSAISTTMIQLAPDATIKYVVGNEIFGNALMTMGTARHANFSLDADEGKIFGSFCLTEIGHGTNTKGMRTTATYDKSKKQLILNTPDFEAAKCWASGLGQIATHGVVFAQLIVDDIHRGLHAFVVPIRDPKTFLPLPGVIVGDLGEKIGLNGVDNGFLIFQNYPIPRENLLNKNGDITEDGRYVTAYKDANKRHGASLGNLSGGRITINNLCVAYGIQALTIAIRYAGVRKQFGPDGEDEVPILEYQVHQHRLLPYLAAGYAMKICAVNMLEVYYQMVLDSMFAENKDHLPDLGTEVHAVSSGLKPVTSWIMRDAIQECREACGGHGYLKVAGIGDIRNNNDANCTYEGENHVLIQQTSRYLLKFWPSIQKGSAISTPLKSVDFLTHFHKIMKSKFSAKNIDEICDPRTILDIYQWIICYLLKETQKKLEGDLKNRKNEFWAQNDIQVFYARTLAIVYTQHFILQRMWIVINEATDSNIRAVLLKLFVMYGLFALEKHMTILYQGGYAVDPSAVTLVQEGILKMCSNLKNDAIALVDAVAPPDFVLNSVLGASDGKVYQRLQSAIFQSPYAMTRPSWWQEIPKWADAETKSKL